MVVDALDLCYTKSHVNTFVIISGDSDFSPLVSKLRENAKYVIGVGVKDSTSDLLVANCDEFIFIDDLVRESRRTAAKRAVKQASPVARPSAEDEPMRKEDLEERKAAAIDIAIETFDALFVERGESGKIWASTLKQAIKRRKPDFNENYFGFKTFGNLLEEAQTRGLIELGRDERSGAYVSRSGIARLEAAAPKPARQQNEGEQAKHMHDGAPVSTAAPTDVVESFTSGSLESLPPSGNDASIDGTEKKPAGKRRSASRKPASKKRPAQDATETVGIVVQGDVAVPSVPQEDAPKRKPAARTGRRNAAKTPQAE
jgi:hypothetical protein